MTCIGAGESGQSELINPGYGGLQSYSRMSDSGEQPFDVTLERAEFSNQAEHYAAPLNFA